MQDTRFPVSYREVPDASSTPTTIATGDAGITAKPNSLFPTRLKYLPGKKHFPSFLYKQSNNRQQNNTKTSKLT